MTRIVRLQQLPAAERPAAEAAVDAIFYAASNTKQFESEAIRAAFRERWLGRYLTYDPAHAFLAIDDDGAVIGYLVGSLDDPARTPRFADIPYFPALADLTALYPAHLHVNLHERARSRGIGGRLVEAFCADVRAGGLPGVHVVTGKGLRNVAFYERLGFLERRALPHGKGEVVFLARDLG